MFENDSDSDVLDLTEARQSHNTELSWNSLVVSALEVAAEVDPYESDLPLGSVVRAVDALNWKVGRRNCDIRPRLLDKASGKNRLVDTGSQISVTMKGPEDKIDQSIKLVAVNGSKIATYGVKEVTIKMGRKAYRIPAVVCDVQQDILGMDFINKYHLNFEWDEFDRSELYLVDKKAQIREPLQVVTVPTDTVRVNYLAADGGGPSEPCHSPGVQTGLRSVEDNEAIAFQVACVKQLGESKEKKKKSINEQLQAHSEEYVKLIKSYPQLLEPSFRKGEPDHGVYHKIETGSHPPCKTKRRPIIMDSAKAAAGKEAWEQMERDGVIERVKPGTNTDWSSALHLAPKAGGGARPCTDFRALNAKTICDAHPLPLLKDFTSKIYGSRVFSVVDLRSAFFNVPIWPPHRHKTLTLSPWGGSFVYNRLAFGLASGPSTWQKLLEHTLRGIPNLFIYLDDILCFGKTKKDHDATLEEVFKRLAANGMALSIDKCKFGQDKVEYLGYSVTQSGIRPLDRKLDSLKQFKPPQSQKDVLHFCGAINYFRTSLKGITLPSGRVKSAAAVLQPLYAIGTEPLPKGTDFKAIWDNSPVLSRAFAEAKQMLGEAVELAHPNANFPLALFTDASDHSVGGALTMLAPDGSFKPLGFYSAHLNETQLKYSVFKKELLGAFKALRHFLPDIYGKHLTIYSDHLPLANIFKAPSDKIPLNDPQVFRQITEIGRFTRDVKHISGVDNVFADYLSRIKPDQKGTAYLPDSEGALPDSEEVAAVSEEVKFQLLSLETIADLQGNCDEIRLIKSGDKPKNTNFETRKMEDKEIFCEISSSEPRPYVPKELRNQIMYSLHFDHLGEKSTLARVSGQYYWPSLKHDVKKFVKCCDSCNKVRPAKKLVTTGQFKVPDKRFSHIMVDVVGPLPESYGHKYILTAICRTTRYLRCLPMKEATSLAAASAFLHGWLNLFGVPSAISSDCGGSFTAALWRETMSKLNVDIKYSALYRPQAMGMIERQHRSIKDSIKASINDMADKHQNRWLDVLPFVVLGKNSALQPDVGASPNELAFGTGLRIPGQLLSDPGDIPSSEQLRDLLQDIKIKTAQPAVQPSRHNPPEKPLADIPANVTHAYTRQHKVTGLMTPFEGPFKIASRPSKSTVQLEVGVYSNGEKRYEIRHLNDLRLAHPESMTAEASRPKLGRPATVPVKGSNQTEAKTDFPSDPKPPNRLPAVPSKQTPSTGGVVDGNNKNETHATSTSKSPVPASEPDGGLLLTGPPPETPFSRPVRSTRNPNPLYVEAIHRPWSASPTEIDWLNSQLRGARVSTNNIEHK